MSGRLSEGYTSALGDLGKLGLKVAASDLAKASPTSTILGLPPFRRSAVDVCAWRAPVHEPCRVMQGHTLADRILDDVKRRAEAVEQRRRGNWPTLAIVLAAPQAASQKYVRVKDKTARCLGIETRVVEITGEETRAASAAAPPAVAPADVSAADGSSSSSSSRADNLRDEDVLRVVRSLNEDPSVDGIIVQLPLPAQLNTHAILQAVAPHKDVDGFHLENQARLLLPPQELGALAPDYATSLRNSFMRGMPTVQPASWVPAPGSSAGSSAGNSAGNSFGGSAANSAGSPPAVGNVGAGRAVGLYPCTPLAVMALLGEYGVRLEGSHVVLLGRSIVVGQPLALMLANEGAATTCLDARSSDDTIARSLAGADVVISATVSESLWAHPTLSARRAGLCHSCCLYYSLLTRHHPLCRVALAVSLQACCVKALLSSTLVSTSSRLKALTQLLSLLRSRIACGQWTRRSSCVASQNDAMTASTVTERRKHGTLKWSAMLMPSRSGDEPACSRPYPEASGR